MPEHIDPNHLKPGPIRHKSLSADLLGQISAVYRHIGPYLGMTLEEFEIGFMRDMHPEREIDVWCGITKAWLAYHEDYLGNEQLPDADEKKLIDALLAISFGIADEKAVHVAADVFQKLAACLLGQGRD